MCSFFLFDMCLLCLLCWFLFLFFSSRRRHTRCALVTGVQTCALPICMPRRIPDYNVVFADWNLISSIGAFGMFVTPFFMFYILWQSKRSEIGRASCRESVCQYV